MPSQHTAIQDGDEQTHSQEIRLSKRLCNYINMAGVISQIRWHPAPKIHPAYVSTLRKWASEGRCALRAKRALHVGFGFKLALWLWKAVTAAPQPGHSLQAPCHPPALWRAQVNQHEGKVNSQLDRFTGNLRLGRPHCDSFHGHMGVCACRVQEASLRDACE